MPPKFHGFNVEEPSSTRVDIPMPMGEDPGRHGLISEYKPNLIDKIGNLVPDTGVGGVLKGLYRGTDQNLFGMLPSGRYESVSPEISTGKAMSFIADPIAGAKSLKYAVSGGTPLSRLIANSIQPEGYTNKWGDIKRTLSSKRKFKEAVIDDIPQYKLSTSKEDRLFAWRTKLGLGKPNPIYGEVLNKRLDPIQLRRGEVENPIDRIWNKFGTHVEDGKTYHHYKNPEDYFKQKFGSGQHSLFGEYAKKTKMKGGRYSGGIKREDYYDNWDFSRNRPIKEIIDEYKSDFYKYGLGEKNDGLSIIFQRSLAESLLNPLEFKGTAKKIYRKPNPGWNISDPYSW